MSGDPVVARIERVAERCAVSITAGLDGRERFWAVTIVPRGHKDKGFTVMEPTLTLALARAATEATAGGWADAPAGSSGL